MKIYSFPTGGITFEDNTAPRKKTAVNGFLPSVSIVPLKDLNGSVYPVVSPGETVKEGMLIGRASSVSTVNIHAAVPGRVVRKTAWKDVNGIDNEALVIKLEGSFEKLGKREEIFPWNGLNGYDIQKLFFDYGIVEMENSGKPLSNMISAARRENEKVTIVIRCIFDDPWVVADYALCVNRFKEIIEGAAITAKACMKTSQVVIAVSDHEKELGALLMEEAGKFDIQSFLMIACNRYPQRNNRELELALRQFEKKEGQDFGSFLILGPSVLSAAYDAVKYKKPCMERYVAVGGSAVRHPQIMKVRIGTRIGEVIEQCGGFSEKPYKIITGSVLSGKEALYLDEPVTKTCYAIVAMAKTQAAINTAHNCINCGECRVVCPVDIDPQNIYKQITVLGNKTIEAANCHGCGCCKLVCPSSLPLSETILKGKQGE